ncbi:MAG: SIS domain-containing protein [Clostridia bacterium]|jgi:D-arabinose 5-phosphate isomerase GutQ|nr:SIS domain-containing protein [Clostridia bacterium]
MRDGIFEIAKNAFDIESSSILKTKERMDKEQFLLAVDALSKAERIGASGCGHTGIACQHFAHLMCCIERPARFISPAEAVHGGLGFLQKGDVILLASRGGKTDELLPIADVCRKKGVTIIGVTEKPESPLAEKSDIVLLMAVERECDKYNCQGTTSFAVTNAIFDALQTAVLEATEFKNEDFAVIHPGGAVGKRLNNK